MKTVAKIGGVIAFIAVLGFLAVGYAKRAANAFSFSVVRYGAPVLNGTYLQLPVVVSVKNPTPLPVNLDNVHADVYILKDGQWIKVAVVDEPISAPAGVTNQTLTPRFDLNAIFGGGASSIYNLINTALTTKKFSVRTDITVQYGQIKVPTQSFTNEIALA